MRGPEVFVPLDVWLRGSASASSEPVPAASKPVQAANEPVQAANESAPPPVVTDALRDGPAGIADAATADALRDVRLFRARLADALDAAMPTLLRELAYAVLGRELQLAPVDVCALVARLIAEHPAATPVSVRVAPGDAPVLPLPAIADPTLAPGDAVVAFAEGFVDARLGVRLATVLEAFA